MRSNQVLRRQSSVAVMVSAAVSAAMSFSVYAGDDNTQLEEVVVTAGLRASLDNSLAVKKTEDHVVEVISSDNINQMPNVTLAESLVSLPGVNGARDRGNESIATVRGLGPRLTMGTVNGREIASSEPNRSVRWEVFPTEEVSLVKVYKTQSADLIAGGVAGTVDVGTVSPLGYKGPEVVVSGGPTYYDEGRSVPQFNAWGDRGGISWVHKFTDDFGVALSGSIQRQKNAFPQIGSWGFTDNTNGMPVNGGSTIQYTPWGASDELDKMNQNRTGFMAALEWRAGQVTTKIDGLYSKITIDEDQDQTWFQDWAYSIYSGSNPYTTAGSSYQLAGNDVVGGTLANSYTRVDHIVANYSENKSLTAVGLNSKWTDDVWSAAADLSYSQASRDNQWLAVDLVSFPASVSYNLSNGVTPTVSTSSDALNDPPAPSWNTAAGQSSGPEYLKDQIAALALDGSRQFGSSGLTALEFGARYASRDKQHHNSSWTQAGNDAPLSSISGDYYYYNMPGLNVPQMIGGNLNALANALLGGWNSSSAQDLTLQRWKVSENTTEGFLKGDFAWELFGKPVHGDAGVRLLRVDTNSTGYNDVGGSAIVPASIANSYTGVLPSATMSMSLSDEQILRLAASKALAKPPLDELATGFTLEAPSNPGQLTGSGQNPKLQPFRADQVDMSYEWYFHREALLAVSPYYKWVKSIIGITSGHQTINGNDYLISGPFNGNGGYIGGVELTFQTPFYFIPGLENFGIYSNYSVVQSNIHEFSPTSNPFPLAGLAKNTADVSLWYSNGTFEARVGAKYHSPYTIVYGWDESQLARLDSETVYDSSVTWHFLPSWWASLQVSNLTNEPLRAYLNNDPNELGNATGGTGGYQTFGRRYQLLLTFKL